MQTKSTSSYTTGIVSAGVTTSNVVSAAKTVETYNKFDVANGDNGWFTYEDNTYTTIVDFNRDKFSSLNGGKVRIYKYLVSGWGGLHDTKVHIPINAFPHEWVLPSVTKIANNSCRTGWWMNHIDRRIDSLSIDPLLPGYRIQEYSEYSPDSGAYFKSINLSKTNITHIGDRAFEYSCIVEGTLVLPPKIEYIGDYAFSYGDRSDRYPSRLITIDFPRKLSYLGEGILFNQFKSNVPRRGVSLPFLRYTAIKDFFSGTPLFRVVDYLPYNSGFWKYSSPSKTQIIGFDVLPTDPARNYFEYYPIPDSVKVIGDGVNPLNNGTDIEWFYGNPVSEKFTGILTIPPTVTSINDYAFGGFKNLKELKIIENGGSFHYSGPSQYRNVSSLGVIDNGTEYVIETVGNTDFTKLGSKDNLRGTIFKLDIKLPNSQANTTGIVFQYEKTWTWRPGFSEPFRHITSANLKRIGTSAFAGCRNLIGSLNLPYSLRYVGKFAFVDCVNLSQLNMSSHSVILDDSAFYGCNPKFPNRYKILLFNDDNLGKDIFPNSTVLTDFVVYPTNDQVKVLSSSTNGLSFTVSFGIVIEPFYACDYYNIVEIDNKVPTKKEYVPWDPYVPFITNIDIPDKSEYNFLVYAVKGDIVSSPVLLSFYSTTKRIGIFKKNDPEFTNEYDTVMINFTPILESWQQLGLNLEFKSSVMLCVFDISHASTLNSGNQAAIKSLIENTNTPGIERVFPDQGWMGDFDIKTFKDGKRELLRQSSQIIYQSSYYLVLVAKDPISKALIISNSLKFYGESPFIFLNDSSRSEIIGTRLSQGYTGSFPTIPDTVTSIGDGAFKGYSRFTGALIIPDTVINIGEYAFQGCSGFTSLTLSSSLTRIKNGAFQGCSGFTGTLTFRSNLTDIGVGAFFGCSGFTGTLTIPSTVTDIKTTTFAGCSGFTGALTIPSSVTSIGDYVFDLCSGFTGALTIPSSVTSIGDYAFRRCSGLTSLTLPPNLTDIKAGTFSGCSGFTGTLTIPSSVTGIQDYAFNGCSGFTGTLTIPSSVISISQYAFRYCSGFTGTIPINHPCFTPHIPIGVFQGCSGFTGALTIPSSVTYITNNAFDGCTGLTSLTLSSGLTNIQNLAFYGCTGLTGTLTIPSSVTSIGTNAFQACNRLTGLTIPSSVTYIGEFAFFGCSAITSLTLHSGIERIYESTFQDCSGISMILKLTCNFISTEAFKNCLNLEIFYPSSAYIGPNAFLNCKSSKSYSNIDDSFDAELFSYTNETTKTTITGLKYGSSYAGDFPNIPSSVTSIANGAFNGYSKMKGTLTIPSTVTSIGEFAFFGCSGFTGSLTIPSSVTNISQYAFYRCSGFTGTLTIPSSVITIGQNAFEGCSKLSGLLTIPSSVITIGQLAFYKCSGFTGTLTIPPNLTSIGDSVFQGCTGLTGTLTIPSSVITIGQSAFSTCSGFTGLTFTTPSRIISIGNYAFYRCSGFTGTLRIPSSLITIGQSAFRGCSGFTGTLTIPSTIESIQHSAFQECTGFTGTLTIPSTVTIIQDYAFYGCTGFTGTLKIPSSITNIGKFVFYGCTGFTSLSIHSSVTSIENDAFNGCSKLSGLLTIPSSVRNIGENAFRGCTGLTSLSIPSSVTNIGVGAFQACSELRDFLIIPIPVNTLLIQNLAFADCSKLSIVYPSKATVKTDSFNNTKPPLTMYSDVEDIYGFNYTDSTKTTITGLKFANYYGPLPTIPNTVTSIANNAFSGNLRITGTLTIPSSVRNIGENAFKGCSNLTGLLTILQPVTNINIRDFAFQGCSNLSIAYPITAILGNQPFQGTLSSSSYSNIGDVTEFNYSDSTKTTITGLKIGNTYAGPLPTIPSSVTTIGGNAFNGSYRLTGTLTIPSTVTSIEQFAFFGCSGFTGLTILSGVTTIGANAFEGCTGFTGTLTIPSSVTNISQYAFYRCSGFTGALTIPSSVTTIGVGAFRGCSGFTGTLTIPSSVITIGQSAFDGCSGFTELTIPSSVITIGQSAFDGCSGFTELTIPSSVITIGQSAFRGCSGFTGTLTIPSTVTNIGDGAFKECSGFTGTLTIPSNLTSIPADLFRKCAGFTGTLTIPSSVITIGDGVFEGCTGLSGTLTFPPSVTSIGQSAFSGCTGFTGTLIIPSTLTRVRVSAFYGCRGFTGLIILPGIENIEGLTFEKLSGLTTTLTIPSTVKTIGDYAFRECRGLTGILTIPRSVTYIGNSAFFFYTGNITYQKNTSLGDDPFFRTNAIPYD